MKPTHQQIQQIRADLNIHCPIHRTQQRKDGSIAVWTRHGMRIWKPSKRKQT